MTVMTKEVLRCMKRAAEKKRESGKDMEKSSSGGQRELTVIKETARGCRIFGQKKNILRSCLGRTESDVDGIIERGYRRAPRTG